jgi:CRISPR-associated exonuclease Cas4
MLTGWDNTPKTLEVIWVLTFNEDELIPISALVHLYYCRRRCALIHIEQVWTENLFTAEGRLMHERVHEQGEESRGKVRIERGVSLRSRRLGLTGIADVVEFHHVSKDFWQPFPVEYKRGKPKPDHSDMIQLCAQAICLEEMMNVQVPCGALYYGRTKHRHDVTFDDPLRAETEKAATEARDLIASGRTPRAVYAKKCENCSLMGECLPEALAKPKSVKRYLAGMLRES